MDATVIVALPAVDDRVNRISSEKVPHLTLLYLPNLAGSDNLPGVLEYVEHVAKDLDPFHLTVDYRGKLGDEDADVLFFEDNHWDLDHVKAFRNNLLLNDLIKRLHDSIDQFPEWTPHITLGYPETPARPDPSDYPGLHSVRFDRIAVWTGEYEGPELRLKHESPAAMELAMSSTTELGAAAAKDLFHYGTKGMKWGVRKDKGHEGEKVKTKKLDKLDKKWEKNEDRKAFWQAHNAAADKMNNGEIDRVNNKSEHKKAADEGKFEDWDNPSPELNAYMKDMDDTFNNHFKDAILARGSNPSGTKRYEMKTDPESGETYVELTDIKHADVGDQDVRYKVIKDAKGMVTKYTPEEVELAHYGVKGMKWGQRKDEAASRGGADSGPTSVVVTQKKPGTFAKTEGGERHTVSDDAIRALEARQKAKKSTTDALTNAELKVAVERMQLEKKYNDLAFSSDRRSKGQRFIAGLFGRKKPKKYTDLDEDAGEKVREAIAEALAAKRAAA